MKFHITFEEKLGCQTSNDVFESCEWGIVKTTLEPTP